MCHRNLHYFPLAVFVLLPTTFITTYLIAVLLNHVQPDFPYISDTGTKPPESCIFGQCLNICALLVCCTAFIKYKQVKEYNRGRRKLLRLNTAAYILGLISGFGLSIVANFQETSVMVVHLSGAMLAFGLGSVYMCLHCIISYQSSPHMNGLLVCHLRVIFCVCSTLFFVITYVADFTAKSRFHGSNPRKWHYPDGGYIFHLVSTISEWIMATFLLAYFATFVPEFKKLSLSPLEQRFVAAATTDGLVSNNEDYLA